MAMFAGFGLRGSIPKAQADTTDVGYRDFSYGSGTASPTGNKPQDKLWYTSDGTWWGILFNSATTNFDIYRFDKATQSWSDTGVVVDKRNNTKSDTLWDGTHLYVADSVVSSSGTDHNAYLRRYSYNPTTQSWTLDSGFPTVIGTGPMEAITLTKDSTGELWATFTEPDPTGQFNEVYVNHSQGSDSSWGQAYALPVAGANNLSLDDISAITAFDLKTQAPKVGIMWSNHNDGAIYFASHTDGTSDQSWQQYPAPVQGARSADDHINLKSLETDPSGRVFAVTKTSYNDGANPDPNAPLIYVSVLGQDGSFSKYVFGTVQDDFTRPILLIDTTNRELYVFAAAPLQNTQPDGTVVPRTIYYKKTSLDNISFAAGEGTPFIRNSADSYTDNPTSTDQNVTSKSGLLVLASSDDPANGVHDYLHNFMSLAADTTPPDTTINSGPTGTVTSNSASFTFSSTEVNSTFRCSLDGAPFTACASPQNYANLSDGQHTFKVAAVDPSGNVDPTPAAAAWTVDATPPDTNITSGPSGTVKSNSATFSFSSTEKNSTFECSLDGAAFTPCTSPQSYSSLSEGQHTFRVRAIDAVGHTDPTPASVSWTVDTTPPETAITSAPSGTVKSRVADISFSASEQGSTFKCSLDGAPFSSCTSPVKYTGLKDGQHTFKVQAIDAAGNADSTPATNTWTVNLGK